MVVVPASVLLSGVGSGEATVTVREPPPPLLLLLLLLLLPPFSDPTMFLAWMQFGWSSRPPFRITQSFSPEIEICLTFSVPV